MAGRPSNSSIALQDDTGGVGRFVVYGLVDPRDGLVHYVGRTLEGSQRPSSHWAMGTSGKRGRIGRRLHEWIHGLAEASVGRYRVITLQTVESFEAAIEAETTWIRRGFAEGWPLTNRNRNGNGGHGRPRESRTLEAA